MAGTIPGISPQSGRAGLLSKEDSSLLTEWRLRILAVVHALNFIMSDSIITVSFPGRRQDKCIA